MRRNHLFLLFLLSHLQYTKHFTDDFYMSSYCIYPLNIKQIAIIGLMLSVTALSCQCGTNELSGFPIPFNWVSYVSFNFTEFTKVARLDACLFPMLKNSR